MRNSVPFLKLKVRRDSQQTEEIAFLMLHCVAVSIRSLGQCSDAARVCAVTQLSGQCSWRPTPGSALIPALCQKSSTLSTLGFILHRSVMCKLEEPLKSHPCSFLFFSLQDNMDLGDEDEDDEKVCSHVLYVTTIYLSVCL